MLLENGAIYFLQDSEGYFPIDYAGMFNHKEVVKIIIEKHCQHFDKMTE
jgi:ankyrin repeat protein